jgi:hypothetical protein
MREGAVRLGALASRDFQLVPNFDRSDAEEFFVRFDAPFDIGFQMIFCRDSARFQRAGECAGQSTGEPRDDMIDGSRQRLGILHAVILRVAAVGAEDQRLFESFDMSFPQGPLLLHQADSRCMNHFFHDPLQAIEMRQTQRKVQAV